MTTQRDARPDRSAAVKVAIRRAAQDLFTTRGFDDTGIRDIASAAGVNPAIVIRHFGSKESLFIETVDGVGRWKQLLDGPVDALGRQAVERIVDGRGAGLNSFGAVMRASGRPEVRARLQDSTIAFLAEPLIERIDFPDAQLRAHLFAAQLVGLMSALAVYDDEVLLNASIAEITALYGPSLQAMLTTE